MFVPRMLLGVEMLIPEVITRTAELKFIVACCHPALFSGIISVWQWCD